MPPLAEADEDPAFDRLRDGAQALTELAAELQISTIHSFATSLLRRHPLEAGIPPTARFVKEDEDDLSDIDESGTVQPDCSAKNPIDEFGGIRSFRTLGFFFSFHRIGNPSIKGKMCG